jgi:hypothetical protein
LALVTTQAPVRTHRAAPTRARTAWWVIAVVLAAAVLFTLYWRQSLSVGLSSDGASNVLQAWDMLHENLLLHNWRVSDVSFYTTELPQYALIEAVLGLGPWVVHVGAAMTYTLLVLLAAWLAKGRARGQAGVARALLAGGIMVAPQLSATQTLLLSPDHTGSALPVLVTWLVIDRSSPGRRTVRWLVPLVVCVILTWAMIADSIVLLTCIAPLVLVCVVRACPGLIRGGPVPRWYELSLAAAAAVAGGLGAVAPRIITALGGYRQAPVKTVTAITTDQLRHQAWVTFQAFLELFGANVLDAKSGVELFFAVLHFAGVILVLCALGLALARFFRYQELLIPVFAVAILLNLGAYMISSHALDILGSRETAAVLPLGAVLAGRVMGEPVLRAAKGWLVPVLAVVAAGYLAALGYGAAQPSVAGTNQPLAAWLVAHGLTDGLAGYWQGNSTTLDSNGRVLVSGVTLTSDGYLKPYQWETDDADYNPSLHDANFVVTGGPAPLPHADWAAPRTFGPPHRIYHYNGYTIMVWDTNILTRLH